MKSLLTLLLLPGFLLAQSPNTCDLVITNGKIIDGTGNSWYRGTLIVNQGKIVSIIRQPSTQKWENSWAPLQVIDAKDKIVDSKMPNLSRLACPLKKTNGTK